MTRVPAVLALLGAGAVAGAGVAADGLLSGGGGPAVAAEPPGAGVRTAVVERRDLRERERLDGTLSFAGARTLAAHAPGVVTAVPTPGRTVRRGGALYAVGARRAATLMVGRVPAFRSLAAGAEDGPDVEQLERNLRALGHDPDREMTVDRAFTAATAAAVRRWQRATGQDPDGQVALGEVVFLPGAVRVRATRVQVGETVRPGRPVLEVTSRTPEVLARIDAARRHVADRGDGVTVELPSGRTVRGRVVHVGATAERERPEDPPTVELRIRLRGAPAAARGLDAAPVGVELVSDVRRGVLVVPVEALVALRGGGFGVEVAGTGPAGPRTIRVRPGLFTDGSVEVTGPGLRAGARVVTAR